MTRAVARPTIVLLVLTVVSAFVLAFTHIQTAGPIYLARQRAAQNAIEQLLPQVVDFDMVYVDDFASVAVLYTCFDAAGDIIGYVFLSRPMGYAGPIEILTALDTDGEIVGIHIVHHRETPGLGSGITDASFREQFAGRRGRLTWSRNPVDESQIHSIASATISVNAVLVGVNDATDYFMEFLQDK